MNQKTKYITTLLGVACATWAGAASAATEKVVVTRTEVTKPIEPSPGQVAGAVITSPFWLAGNIVAMPFRAAAGTDVWPSPAPIGEMTTTRKVVTYTEPMAIKHSHHKYHHRKHAEPVGELTIVKTTTYRSTEKSQNVKPNSPGQASQEKMPSSKESGEGMNQPQ